MSAESAGPAGAGLTPVENKESTMYFGSSPETDFSLCFGLGVAFVMCAVTAAGATHLIVASSARPILKAIMRVVAFVVCSGAMLSVCAVIGGTRDVRDASSSFGFDCGVLAAAAMAVALYRLQRSSNKTDDAGSRGRGPADR